MNYNEKDTECVSETQQTDVSTQEKDISYNTPKLIRYGGLAELVQNRPGRAMDGGVGFPDCTLT